MKYVIVGLLSFILLNCKQPNTKVLSAESIINTAIEISGADKIGHSTIDFDFRDKHYYATRRKGNFSLSRLTVEANTDSIFDVLSNNGFKRYKNNNELIFVEDSMQVKYSASVNSVHYFSVLPYGLNDEAVNKTRLKDIDINGKTYHTIQVTFNQNGGGEDYEDEFLYWVQSETFEINYLAYSYNEDDGLGVRFREVFNERFINNIRFVDYNNYKPNDASISLIDLPKLFENGQLKLLSKIELKNVTVN